MPYNPKKETIAKLKMAIEKYNTIIDKTISEDYDVAKYMPPFLSVKEELSAARNNDDLRRRIRQIDMIHKIGMLEPVVTKSGVQTTKYELNILQQNIKRINKWREKERKRLAIYPSTTKGTMGALKLKELMPLKNRSETISPTMWSDYIRGKEEQSRPSEESVIYERYKLNYLTAVNNMLGEAGKNLYNYVNGLSAKFVYDSYYKDAEVQIDFVYTQADAKYVAERALSAWQSL